MIKQKILLEIQANIGREEFRINSLLKELRKDEEFKSIEEKKDWLSFQIAKLESLGEPLGSLKSDYEEIVELFYKKLKTLKVSKKLLEINHICPLCKDTGMIKTELCTCVKNKIYQSLSLSFGEKETEETFFKESLADAISAPYKEHYIKVLKVLNGYTEKFPNVKNFILRGKVGCGKTFLATVVANNLMTKGFSVLKLTSFKMNEVFLNYHLSELREKRNVIEPLLDCDLLILDDLGAENLIKNVTLTYLLEILVLREKPILVTTNLTRDGLLNKYEERIFSRLSGKNVSNTVEILGEDLRNN